MLLVSTVAVQGRTVVMAVSCWPTSAVAEVLLVSKPPRRCALCAKKFALRGPIVGASAKKFALRAENTLISAFLGLLGELFRARVVGIPMLGEFFRANRHYAQVLSGSSPVEWCNRFVSFGVGYALSWSGVSSCWVGWGVSRDLVRMSRLR